MLYRIDYQLLNQLLLLLISRLLYWLENDVKIHLLLLLTVAKIKIKNDNRIIIMMKIMIQIHYIKEKKLTVVHLI